jgi:hypothetical protein
MPSGQTSTLLNRKPIYVGDDTVLSSVAISGVGPGDVAPSIRGQIRQIVNSGAQTLTAAQSGALCLFNTAAGYTYTLPAPIIGLTYEFLHTVTNTSVVAKVITDSASTFLLGEVFLGVDNTTPAAGPGPKGYALNGTTHRAVNQGGADTTTGGVIGSRFRVTCVTSTQWAVEGFLIGAGTIATPVATS